MANEARLEWSMAIDGDALRVSYRITNVSDHPIWRCDALVVPGRSANTHALAPGRLVVLNGDAPGDVSFTLGQRGADQPLIMVYPPHWQKMLPGETHEGQASLKWPLEPWHNQGYAEAFFAPPRRATLQIEYAALEPTWSSYTGDDGATFQIGNSPRAAFAVGQTLELPAR